MDVAAEPGRVVGRYVLYDEIASGGMATVHLGRMLGQVGFARVVAVKRLHSHLARDPEFVAMFLDEARLAAGVRHPNVVATLDVVAVTGELFLVMEYVEGDSLSHLIRFTRRAGEYIPPPIAGSIICNMLYGLHAAHVATDDRGSPLQIVHRDVSPQNILIGIDGITRVADFGVAKASRRLLETEAGRMKGKFSYMAPESVRRDVIDHRADVFCAGTCAWEALTGRHLFRAEDPGRVIVKLLEMPIEPPSALVAGIPPEVDAIVLKALERDPDKRFQTAREMAIALEDALPPAIPRKVGEWALRHVGAILEARNAQLAKLQPETGSEVELAQIAQQVSNSVAPPPVVSPPKPLEVESASFPGEPSLAGAAESAGPAAAEPEAEQPAPPAAAVEPSAGDAAEPSERPEPAALRDDAAPVHPGSEQLTPISQMSGLLSASYTEPPPDPARRVARALPLPLLIGGAAASVVVLGIALVMLLSSGPSDAIAPPAAQPAPSGAPTSALAARGPREPEVKPVETPAPEPEPEPAAPAPQAVADEPPPATKAPATATAERPAAEAPKKPIAAAPAKPAPAKPAAGGCNPPYVIENGIKKFKRHCL